MELRFLTGTIEYIVIATLATAACASGLFFYARRHRDERERKFTVFFLKTLRTAALILAAIVSLAPSLSYDITEHEKGKVLIAFDSSASMKFASGSATRYWSAMKTVSDGRLIERIAADNELFFANFASAFKPTSSFKEIAGTSPDGNSDITGTLTEIMGRNDLSAAIIFSDGQSTSDYPASQVARYVKFPVFTVGVGETGKIRDASITEVSHPKICYKNEKTEISVDIFQTGMTGLKSLLIFRENGETREQVPLSFDRERIGAKISFEPRSEGLTRFDIELQSDSAEVTAENNRYPFFMNVTAHKIRVLYIETSPRQDFAFLHRFLTTNKDISFTSKFLDTPSASMKLSKQDIGKFDVMILGNIDFSKLDAEIEKSLFESANNNNSAVLFLGGPLFSMPSTSLFRDRFPLKSESAFAYDDSSYKPVPTEAGNNHQIIKISPISKINSFMWNDVPELCGVNYTADAATQDYGNPKKNPGILVAAQLKSKALKSVVTVPILSVQSHLNKKNAALLGNSTWFLKFGQASSKNSQFYDKFFGNLLVWLYSRDESRAFSVETDRTNYFVDDSVYVSVFARNQDFSPMINPAFSVSLISENGEKIPVATSPSPIESGCYEFTFKTQKAGQYSLSVEAGDERNRHGSGAAKFITVNSARESLKVAPNFDTLKEISEKTGGKFFETSNAGSIPSELPQKGRINVIRAEFRPAESAWVFWAIFLLLALEWTIRRASGYE